MYKIFVVEDEPLIRQTIRNTIEAANANYCFCGEAGDGEIALSIMLEEQPDILITDIKMPFMDGLELSKLAKSMLPWLKIIILSGHDEFEFAQKAISIGVERYLLKPVCQSTLKSEIENVITQIENESKHLSSGYNETEIYSALHQQFMQNLFMGKYAAAELIEHAKKLNIPFLNNYYRPILLHLSLVENTPIELQKIASEFAEFAESSSELPPLIQYPDKLTILFSSATKEAINKDTYNLVNILKKRFEKHNITVTTALGRIVDRVSQISSAYNEVERLFHKTLPICTGEVIDVDAQYISQYASIDLGNTFSKRYEQRLRYATKSDIDAMIQDFTASLSQEQFNSALFRYYTLVDIVNLALRLTGENLGEKDNAFQKSIGNLYQIFQAAGTKKSFVDMALDILNTVAELMNNNANCQHSSVIKSAEEYICKNYNSPDISLHTVARYAGFSPAHFSMLFSQKVGKTFIEYLTEYRIEKSKLLLLSTDEKLSNIALEIGYNEPSYFSYVFKKRESMTPKEFRARHQKRE